MNEAEMRRQMGRRTVLFVDEIHRFNKAQQDAFLPFVEKGSIILIGATTENPSFEVNSALLSRCKVFVLKAGAKGLDETPGSCAYKSIRVWRTAYYDSKTPEGSYLRLCQWGRPHCAEYAGDGGIKRRDERKRDPDYGRVFGTMYQPEISSV